MPKNTIIGVAVVLVVIVGISIYAGMKPVPVKITGTTGNTSTLLSGNYIENAKYYDIVANYATSTQLQVGADAATKLMKSFVSGTIAQFKSDGNFDNLTDQDIRMMGFDQGRKENLRIVYMIASTPRTVSYIFTVYEDTLGAHENMFFRTFTFDTKTGVPLALADVCTPGSPYLNTLSSISRAKLPSVIGDGADANFIKNGTMPEDKNFENFFFDNRDFVVLFPPYQVGPYAAGPQTLRIPISELADILKPEYR